ncbi:MAG TPA: right-handed parallel beta-helix repeat-containing protein [Pirellulaceae bacterium]|nr:right-handed parallel beta-helix repeat-containing protein [Pirellulaceae bacterium]
MRFASLLALLLVLTAATAAPARDIYVDNLNGDDRRHGETPVSQGAAGGPCRSIAKALRVAKPGDRIIVANTGQPYRECVSIQGGRHSGSGDYPFEIIGNGATLDGRISLAENEWEFVAADTFRTRPPRMSYQQLFLGDVVAARRFEEGGRFPALEPLEWILLDGWIYFRVEPGKLPQSYDLSCCGHQVALTLYDVHDVIVRDLVVRGYQLDGVNCHDNVRRSDLINLTCIENGRSGISIGGASRVRIDTCTAAGNGAAQLRVEGYCIVQTIENTFDGTSAPAIVREGGTIIEEK